MCPKGSGPEIDTSTFTPGDPSPRFDAVALAEQADHIAGLLFDAMKEIKTELGGAGLYDKQNDLWIKICRVRIRCFTVLEEVEKLRAK